MCCATLMAQETTMATTQLMWAACCDLFWPMHDDKQPEYRPVRMNWVVATDENGNRRLRIDWRAGRND